MAGKAVATAFRGGDGGCGGDGGHLITNVAVRNVIICDSFGLAPIFDLRPGLGSMPGIKRAAKIGEHWKRDPSEMRVLPWFASPMFSEFAGNDRRRFEF